VKFEENQLPFLKTSPCNEIEKQEFQSSLESCVKNKESFYNKMVENFLFHIKKDSYVLKNLIKNIEIESKFNFDKFMILFWKCLIELDPNFKSLISENLKKFIKEITLKFTEINQLKILYSLVRFVQSIFICDIIFEDFLISLRFMHRCVKPSLLNQETVFLGTPGVVNRFITFPNGMLRFLPKEDSDRIFSFPFFHAGIAGNDYYKHYYGSVMEFDQQDQIYYVKNYLLDTNDCFCNLNFPSIRYKIFNTESENNPLNEIEMFVWDNPRCLQNVQQFSECGVFQALLDVRESFPVNKDYTVKLDRGNMSINILQYVEYKILLLYRGLHRHEIRNKEWLGRIQKRKEVFNRFQIKLLNKMDESDTLSQEIVKENDNINNQDTENITLKEIPLKVEASQTNSLKNDRKNKKPAKLEKCCKCEKIIQLREQHFILARFHNYEVENLFKKTQTQNTRPIYTSCKHFYHLECLPLRKYTNHYLTCYKCQKPADIFLGTLSGRSDIKSYDLYTIRSFLFSNIPVGFLNENSTSRKMFDTYLSPVVNVFKIIKTISYAVFANNIFPCVSRLMWFVYHLFDFNPGVFGMLIQESQQKLRKYSFWDIKSGESSKLDFFKESSVEWVFIEVVFANLIIRLNSYFIGKLRSKDTDVYNDQFYECIFNSVEEMLLYFLMAKLVFTGGVNLIDITEETLFRNCYDLLWIANILACSLGHDPYDEIEDEIFEYKTPEQEQKIKGFIKHLLTNRFH
jgi:predicted DNA-binding transcriptional regulator